MCFQQAEILESYSLDVLPRHPVHGDLPPTVIGANRKGGLSPKDSFRLTFTAFKSTFYVHLAPHEHIVHSGAKVVVDGREDTSLSTNVRVYTGAVFSSKHASDRRFHRGKEWRKRAQAAIRQTVLTPKWPPGSTSDADRPFDFDADARRGSAWRTGFDADEEFAEVDAETEKVGTARIVVHSHSHDLLEEDADTTFEGVISLATGGKRSLYTIKTLESYASTREEHDAPAYDPSAAGSAARRATMIIYREDDKKENRFAKRDNDGNFATSKTCGAETLNWNVNGAAEEFWRLQVQKRKIDENSVPGVGGSGKLQKRAAAGCPTRPKTLRMGVAADCSYVATYGSAEAALRQIITNMALASRVYENVFNVALSLIRIEMRAACYNKDASAAGLRGPGSNSSDLEVWNQPCVDPAYTINRRLSDFSKWRGERSEDDVGLWHLMTRCSSDSTVGISWLNMLCQTDSFSQGTTSSSPVPKNGGGQVAVINVNENKLRNLVAGAGEVSTESAKKDSSRPKVVALAATGSGTKNAVGGTEASDSEEFVSGTGVSSTTREEWRVVAHEIGHNFGAIHDCQAEKCRACPSATLSSSSCNCCPCGTSLSSCDCGGVFLMNPTSDSGPGQFSSCSTTDICGKLSAGSGSCLVDAAAPANASIPKVVAASQCGNGLKEEGEECDCGPDVQCRSGRNACCDASCKLKPGAVCSDSNDLCCNGCKPVAAKTLCRPAVSSCDVPETCDGTSGECPPDLHLPDGQDCSNGDALNSSFTNKGLKCAAGLCTSRDLQCQIRMMQPGVVGCSSFQSSCSLLCSTSSGANCVELQGGFVDSTPCGYGGLCKQGVCTGGSLLIAIRAFIEKNKLVSIAVGVVVVILLMLAVTCGVRKCCRRRALKNQRKNTEASVPPGGGGGGGVEMRRQPGGANADSAAVGKPKSSPVASPELRRQPSSNVQSPRSAKVSPSAPRSAGGASSASPTGRNWQEFGEPPRAHDGPPPPGYFAGGGRGGGGGTVAAAPAGDEEGPARVNGPAKPLSALLTGRFPFSDHHGGGDQQLDYRMRRAAGQNSPGGGAAHTAAD